MSFLLKYQDLFNPGWWLNPSEKYESQLGLLFSIYWKMKNIPNHQSESVQAPKGHRWRVCCIRLGGVVDHFETW